MQTIFSSDSGFLDLRIMPQNKERAYADLPHPPLLQYAPPLRTKTQHRDSGVYILPYLLAPPIQPYPNRHLTQTTAPPCIPNAATFPPPPPPSSPLHHKSPPASLTSANNNTRLDYDIPASGNLP
ncbi:hypothetical protein B0T14DRAFT_497412 [Immersiella caudata]|uniref:Uncharacterized protein n=1 Tax=Immersiella caudata TaxID=314043 RepID=A0AA39WT14_9PEZI|nr:hypothetical protein B0T14DRAFT_497412 [Immersiella caudata]